MLKKIVRRALPDVMPELPGIPPFLSKIYAARGVSNSSELELILQNMLASGSLKGLEKAVELIAEAVVQQKKIVIVGDFDADGATSTTLAVEALSAMGALQCSYVVPDRFRYGYGLTPEIVELVSEQNPDLIITVDNGISSIEGVSAAHALGIKVVVTDHHLPAEVLPAADAIVNPAQIGCQFPSKNLAGVGVIFYVMSALRARLRQLDWFEGQGISPPNMAEFLDLVALGTVADLVSLDQNNRILVEQGVRRIRAGRARPGILALFEVAGRSFCNAVTSDLGFAVGPRLNAAGRLDDMATGIECLRSKDMLEAKQRARVLHDLNAERKNIEEDMRRDAEQVLSTFTDTELEQKSGVVLYEPHWHQGVIGILASRVKERVHRPVVAFAPETDDPNNIDVLKGSARSIPGVHMRDALDLVAKRNPSVLQKFGGHAMAAGMTIRHQDIELFSQLFDSVVKELVSPEDLEAVILSDGELQASELELTAVEALERAGPWGQGFPEPLFDAEVRVAQVKVLKERHLKLVVELKDGVLMDAIQFSSPFCHQALDRIKIVYRPSVNEFRGRKSVQLLVEYLEPLTS